MSEAQISQDQIKQLAMDWYAAIIAEIRAEQTDHVEEVITECTQNT